MKKNIPICVLIPVYNNVEKAALSIESVFADTYNGRVDCIVMDFGSTDSSYSKLLDLRRNFPFTLYQIKHYVHPKSRIAYLQRAAGYFYPCVYLCLIPGDTLLHGAFYDIDAAQEKYKFDKAAFLFKGNGMPHNFKVGSKAMRGVDLLDHAIQKYDDLFSYRCTVVEPCSFATGRWLGNGINNESIFLQDICYLKKYIYVPRAIVSQSNVIYDDEFEEVMYRFGVLISHFRTISDMDSTRQKLLRQLSFYALWRSRISFNKGNKNDSQKCFLLAPVIYDGIVDEDEFLRTKKLLGA